MVPVLVPPPLVDPLAPEVVEPLEPEFELEDEEAPVFPVPVAPVELEAPSDEVPPVELPEPVVAVDDAQVVKSQNPTTTSLRRPRTLRIATPSHRIDRTASF
jgi:hypothetical protein